MPAPVIAQSDRRRVLELVEAAPTTDETKTAVGQIFGLSPVRTAAVVESQFRRVRQADRERVAAELSDLRAERADLESN